MVQRQLPEFDTVTRCDRRIPCQVCEERERGCPLRCAHDYGEAAQALARLDTLPDLVVLDLHFALPEEKLLPEDKSSLPPPEEPKARKTAIDGLRRKQGLLILEKLRATYPKLPVVMLTTTGSDLGAERPADPLVYLARPGLHLLVHPVTAGVAIDDADAFADGVENELGLLGYKRALEWEKIRCIGENRIELISAEEIDGVIDVVGLHDIRMIAEGLGDAIGEGGSSGKEENFGALGLLQRGCPEHEAVRLVRMVLCRRFAGQTKSARTDFCFTGLIHTYVARKALVQMGVVTIDIASRWDDI